MTGRRTFWLASFFLLLLGAMSCTGLPELDATLDSDGDGWSDARERAAGTAPDRADSDGDGYWDPHDPNPLDPNVPTYRGQQEPAVTPTPSPAATPTTHLARPTISPRQAAAEELEAVQSAVRLMMQRNGQPELQHPVVEPTNDMRRFPDATTRHGAAGVGYVLFNHDVDGDGKPDINYVRFSQTKGTYVCDRYGEVAQVTTGYER